jgi:hypothetical protein
MDFGVILFQLYLYSTMQDYGLIFDLLELKVTNHG